MVESVGSSAQFDSIEMDIEAENYAQAESSLKQVLAKTAETDAQLREHEKALTTLGALYKEQQ